MVNRTLIKLSLVGTAILALSVGLGVGLTKRKSNNDKSNSYSNAETTSFGDNAATISSDDCDEVSNADAVVRKRILVLENDEYRLAKAPIRRRALRHNAVQTVPVGWFTESSMSLSMSFAVANSSKSGKSTKGKHGSSKKKKCKTSSTMKSKSSKCVTRGSYLELSMSLEFDTMSLLPKLPKGSGTGYDIFEFGQGYKGSSKAGKAKSPTTCNTPIPVIRLTNTPSIVSTTSIPSALTAADTSTPTYSPSKPVSLPSRTLHPSESTTSSYPTESTSSFFPTYSPSTSFPTYRATLPAFFADTVEPTPKLTTTDATVSPTSGSTPTVSTEVTGPPTVPGRDPVRKL